MNLRLQFTWRERIFSRSPLPSFARRRVFIFLESCLNQCMDTFRPDVAVKRLKPLLRMVGEKIFAIQRSGQLSVRRKKAQYDVVTRADKLAEKMIVDHIKKHYPDHSIRGEEGTDVRHKSPYQWFIDPIDGTA